MHSPCQLPHLDRFPKLSLQSKDRILLLASHQCFTKMSLLDKILSFFKAWSPFGTGFRPDILENSPFTRLPSNSFNIWRDHSLSSCCFFRFDLSADIVFRWEPIFRSTHEGERIAFLSPLERELPDHVLCFYCGTQQLHVGSKARHSKQLWPLPNNWPPACTKEDNRLHVESYIHQKFNFITFQSAMKRHQQGLDCGVLYSFLCYQELV